MLRPASRWRERYALAEDDHELAAFEGKGWGRRRVKVTVDDPRALDPGLLLFRPSSCADSGRRQRRRGSDGVGCLTRAGRATLRRRSAGRTDGRRGPVAKMITFRPCAVAFVVRLVGDHARHPRD
jgi:hypothetical protein